MFANNFIQIVVNPSAGSGKAKKIAETLPKKAGEITSGEINIKFTEERNHATFIVREALKNGAEKIIAVGGDGTINEVINGFFENGRLINPLCELGIISCGTGRGFANSMKLPDDIDQQIKILGKPGFNTIDIGRIIYQDIHGERAERFFVNECQTGIGSKVASQVGSGHKIFGGKLAFGVTATIQAILIKPLELKIEFDAGPGEDYKLIGLVVGNGTECAGGMKLTPEAKMDDGQFDVLLIHNMSVIKRLINLTKVYSGTHILTPYFSVRRCKKIKITSSESVSLEADGEMLGTSPFEMEILPSAVRVKTGFN